MLGGNASKYRWRGAGATYCGLRVYAQIEKVWHHPCRYATEKTKQANVRFFSLAELNAKLATLVTQFNDKPMAAPRAGSRRELFEAVERAALGRLPGCWRARRRIPRQE